MQVVAEQLRVPFWTVDADVIVPSKLLMKEQYGAYTARPVIRRLLPEFLQPVGNTRAKFEWTPPRRLKSLEPDIDITEGWKLDRSVAPVSSVVGGTDHALKRLKRFYSGTSWQIIRSIATSRSAMAPAVFPPICILDT